MPGENLGTRKMLLESWGTDFPVDRVEETSMARGGLGLVFWGRESMGLCE